MVSVSTPLLSVLFGYIIAAFVMLFLTVYTAKERERSGTRRSFVTLFFLLSLWSGAIAGRVLAPSLSMKLFFHYLVYLAVVFTPVAWFLFALYYTGRTHRITRLRIVAISLPLLAQYFAVLLNPGQLYYRSIGTTTVMGSKLIELSAGPLYWPFVAYSYLLLTGGLVILVQFALTSDQLYRIQSLLLVIATVFPLATNTAFLAASWPIPHVDLTPLIFAVSGLFLAAAIYYGGFVELMPVEQNAIIESLDDGIVVTDGSGRIIFANPEARSLLGETLEQSLVGTQLSTAFPCDVDGKQTDEWEASTEREGRTHWYLFRQIPFEQTRTPSGTIYTITDITERKERERELRERQRMLEQIVQWTDEAIDTESDEALGQVAVDIADSAVGSPLAGMHLLSDDNQRLEAVAVLDEVRKELDTPPSYNRDGDDTPSQLIWETFENQESIYIQNTEEYDDLASETPARAVIIHPLERHGVFIISATEPAAFDEADRYFIELLAQILTAVLDRHERERELRSREQQLTRENERLDQFTSVISHDLRSPLNVVELSLDMLDSEYDDDHIDSARDSLDRATTMLSDLLDLAQQGKTVEEPESADLNETIRRAWQSIPTKDASLEIVDDFGQVPADHSRLQEVFGNLFRNTIEHGTGSQTTDSHSSEQQGSEATAPAVETTERDLPTVRIGCLSSEPGLYVADDGPGIPEDIRDEIFEQGFTTTESGTGFGLAIVSQIVTAHGWDISVSESWDGGARFEISGISALAEQSPD